MKNKISFKQEQTVINFLMGFVLITCLMMLDACSKSSATPPTPVETNTKLLTASTWKIQSVQVDGVDKTTSFTGMTLTFTNSTYSTTNGNVVWATSGTWSFTDVTATAFTRDDGVQVSIKSISASSLQLGLTWTKTTLGGGRANSVAGQYVFVFGI